MEGDLVAIITGGVTIALVGLMAVIGVDRARAGWNRAEAEAAMRRQQLKDLGWRADQLLQSIGEQNDTIAARTAQIADLDREVGGLKRDLDGKEVAFRYTTVPVASGDMYGPTWRFMARNPALAEGSPPDHPSALWDAGRPYIVGALSQSEARSTMDRLLPRHRGFVIVAVGSIVGQAPKAEG
ncbi:hypothetical protein [Ferrovibrio sp.]|uniref:hypothetical protein n=1 Tax=Ferrovibrio sp. TaxID=1917215 RepID=UPI00311D7F32